MSWLQNIQSMVDGEKGGSPLGGLGSLLGPAALGGLVGALLAGGSAKKIAKSALFIGGGATLGAVLWNKYKGRLTSPASAPAATTAEPATSLPAGRAERLVLAMVFAARSDGHIDDKERAAIEHNVKQLNLDAAGERLVREAMTRPLDPAVIASGVYGEAEALEIYLLSCAVLDVDHFMERSYLDALAKALGIPDDVKQGLEKDVHSVPA